MFVTGTPLPAWRGCIKRAAGARAWRLQAATACLVCTNAHSTFDGPAAVLPCPACRGGRDGELAASLLYSSNQELREAKKMERGPRAGAVGAVAAYIQVGAWWVGGCWRRTAPQALCGWCPIDNAVCLCVCDCKKCSAPIHLLPPSAPAAPFVCLPSAGAALPAACAAVILWRKAGGGLLRGCWGAGLRLLLQPQGCVGCTGSCGAQA